MFLDLAAHDAQVIIQHPRQLPVPVDFAIETAAGVHHFHRQLPGYRPTELVSLPALAHRWQLANIWVKDESSRFNLNAFKVLGGSYAVARLLCQRLSLPPERINFQFLTSEKARKQIGPITLTSATDGNHGRGVAWAAQQLGLQAVIFMPKGSAQSRVNAIRSHGATVEVTDLNYDDAVRLACKRAEQNDWHIIQDTGWEGYEEIPTWIMQGYLTMCREAVDQMEQLQTFPTHVFIQAGVGAFAGSVIGYFLNAFQEQPPRFIIMEPNNAACIFASAQAGDGQPHAVTGDLDTIMAGLACGEPNSTSWELLRDAPSAYVRCADYVSANGIRILANPLDSDSAIEAGESGSPGPGLLQLITTQPDFRKIKDSLSIGPGSRVLFFNTEGATDPDNYRDIVWFGKYPGIPFSS